jgi:hypothetical protein
MYYRNSSECTFTDIKELPPGEEVVDFYHAAEHHRRAFDHVYGESSPKAQATFKEYRHLLPKAEDGVWAR